METGCDVAKKTKSFGTLYDGLFSSMNIKENNSGTLQLIKAHQYVISNDNRQVLKGRG